MEEAPRVSFEGGTAFVTVNRKRYFLLGLPEKYETPLWQEVHDKLKEPPFEIENVHLRDYIAQTIKEFIEKEETKKLRGEEKQFKLEEATRKFTDFLEMADKFIEIQPIFYTAQKIWWLWDFEKKCWRMVDEVDLLNRLNERVSGVRLFEAKTKQEVLNALKMRGRENTPKPAKKTWVQFRDKIYDIETDLTFEATPEFHVTNPLPYELGDSEETPEIDKLFKEWVDEEDVPLLYEILAYAMLPDYPLHRTFCLNGAGRNGKGSYLQILTKFIGKENVTSTDFDTLTSRPFEAAKLYKKLVCMMGEINSIIFKRTSLFKKLTGADIIGYEFKGKDGFDDYNYAKLLIATNKLPESTDKTVGFYSRWRIVDFNNEFEENPYLLQRIPEQEYRNLALKSVKILKRLLNEGKFSGDGNIEERMKRYEERASPLRDFLNKRCKVHKDYDTPFWEIYQEYVAFLEERGFRRASKRELSNLLKARGFTTTRKHYTKDSGEDATMHFVVGISLKDVFNEEEAQKKDEKQEKIIVERRVIPDTDRYR